MAQSFRVGRGLGSFHFANFATKFESFHWIATGIIYGLNEFLADVISRGAVMHSPTTHVVSVHVDGKELSEDHWADAIGTRNVVMKLTDDSLVLGVEAVTAAC